MARVVDTAGRPFSGQVPFAVLGICVNVKDPDELGRIRCLFPTLPKNKGKEPWSWWIRQQAPNAGKERGFYAVPEPLDEVLVVFLYGAQDIGIVVGQFWNGKDVPPAEAKDGMPKEADTDTDAKWSTELHTEGSQTLDNNDRRFWRSRGTIKDEPPVGYEFAPEFEDTEVGDWHGHLIAFDDTPGKETLQVWDQTRKMAFIMDSKKHIMIMANVWDDGDIHIRTKRDLYLEAGRDVKMCAKRDIWGESTDRDTIWKTGRDFTRDVGRDDITEAKKDIKRDAGMNYDLKAGINAKLKANVSFTAEGGNTATLKSGMLTRVKGGMVMIN